MGGNIRRPKRHGQAIIEFLFAFLIIFPLFAYMIDFQDQLHSNMLIMSAAREGARWATRHSGLTIGDVNRPIHQAVWRACDYLASATGDFDGSICPMDRDSYTTPNGIVIKAGWWDENDPLLMPKQGTRIRMPGGPQRVTPAYTFRQVPVWVVVYWEKDRIIGLPPLNQKVRAIQQATLMMDNY